GPGHSADTDRPTLRSFLDRHPFGLVVSVHDGRPMATHLPVILDRSVAPDGALLGHVARANPQWRQLRDQEVLAIFNGPHAYVSPSWYQAEKVVPTWNYVAVHAYGQVELIEDSDSLVALVHRLTRVFEKGRPPPWDFDPGDAYVRKVSLGIVGCRLTIERLEGKWKRSQNHPEERRRCVIDGLREQGGEDQEAIASLMAAMLGIR